MDIKECIKFANENPVCYLATSVADQPHVRCLGLWFADDTGFYFQTGNIKQFPRELQANPRTEICFYHHEGMIGTMLRVSGAVEFLTSPELKKKVLLDRPFLRDMGIDENENSYKLVLFRIAHGQAHFWTMSNNLRPKKIIEF